MRPLLLLSLDSMQGNAALRDTRLKFRTVILHLPLRLFARCYAAQTGCNSRHGKACVVEPCPSIRDESHSLPCKSASAFMVWKQHVGESRLALPGLSK